MRDCLRSLHFALAIGAATGLPLAAQKKPVTQPIVAAAVAGQTIAVLPANLVTIDSTVKDSTIRQRSPVQLHRWVDSVVIESFAARAPDVKWISAFDLRKIYRRNAGLLPDPDQMGQSMMKTWALTIVPDPLRGNLRRLLAVANGSRYAFIPASLLFAIDSTGGLKAELAAVLADVRTGKVVWRSVAKGSGGTPGQVLGKALATIFPNDEGQ
jgi:hypothetical protein